MTEHGEQSELFDEVGGCEGVQVVNERCVVRTQDGRRVVIVASLPLVEYPVGDRTAEAHAMVQLVEQGWAEQIDVARVFGCSPRTLRRYQQRFDEGGLGALGRPVGYPRGQARISKRRTHKVVRWKEEKLPNREIARRLGVSEKAVRKLLSRAGWCEPVAEQHCLVFVASEAARGESRVPAADPKLSAFSSATAQTPSLDTDPANRWMDRLMAVLGLLEDAPPLFRSEKNVPRTGVLAAVPVLIESGVFSIAREVYGSIGPAFYGLRTTILTLLLMALLRIKRPEGLKEHSPAELGRVLGLDRAPEVKTLRRKLSRLAALGRASELGRRLAEHRVRQRSATLGFLYVDGHVRVYHGKHALPKAYVVQRRLAMPATSDYWVNDAVGDPLFVLTAEANAGMTKMLPKVLAEVRRLIGPERRVTVVFDRGGFSAKLFRQMIADGFDILTYRKGRVRRVPKKRFTAVTAELDGREVRYTLADQTVRLLQGKLSLRQVTRLCDDGQHQTPILTSRRDLPAIEVAYRMFERWRQENFFKYLRAEYALDALVDYTVVADDPRRDVPNPARKAMDAKLRATRARLTELKAEYGSRALTTPGKQRATVRGFKIAQSELGRAIRLVEQRIDKLKAQRDRLPKRVAVGDVARGTVVKLAPERQHLTSLLKMVAYQAESDLLSLIAPHYKRADDEGRTLVQAVLNSTGHIDVTTSELLLSLAPLSSPHRTRALAALCEALNQNPVYFPGSRLRLRFDVTPASRNQRTNLPPSCQEI